MVLLTGALAVGLALARPVEGAPRIALGEFRDTGTQAEVSRWGFVAREGLRQRLQSAGILDLVDAASTPQYVISGSVGGPAGLNILAVKVMDVVNDVQVASHFYPFALSDGLLRVLDEAARVVLARLVRPRPSASLFSDTFIDPTLATWDVFIPSGLGREHSVEVGALRLRSQVALLTKASLPRDLVIRFQMRFEDNVRAQLGVVFGSQTPFPRQHYQFALYPDRYFAQLRDGTLRSLRPGQVVTLSPWQWYEVTVEVWNNEMRLWIDGQLIASVLDTFGQLKGGNFGFQGSECWIDNVRVHAIDGVRP
jgi:hypothetical protein